MLLVGDINPGTAPRSCQQDEDPERRDQRKILVALGADPLVEQAAEGEHRVLEDDLEAARVLDAQA